MTVKTEIKSFASIWDAQVLGFEETQNLRLKSQLLMALSERIKSDTVKYSLRQTGLAKKYKLSQSILSWIVTGKMHKFSLSSLLKIAGQVGMKIEMTIT